MASTTPPKSVERLTEAEVRSKDLVGRLLPFPEQRNGRQVVLPSQLEVEERLKGGLDYLITNSLNGDTADEDPYALEEYQRNCRSSDNKFVKHTAGCSYGDIQFTRLLINHASLVPHFRKWRCSNPDVPLLILNLDSHHDEWTRHGYNVLDCSWAYHLNRLRNTSVLHLQSQYSDSLSPAWRGGAQISCAPDDQLGYLAAACAFHPTHGQRGVSVRGAPLGSPWHSAYEHYLEHCQMVHKGQRGLEVWVTIDFDYFYLEGRSNPAPSPNDYHMKIEEELLNLSSLLHSLEAPLKKVIPVLSPLYLPRRLRDDVEFQKTTVMLVHQVLGGFGKSSRNS